MIKVVVVLLSILLVSSYGAPSRSPSVNGVSSSSTMPSPPGGLVWGEKVECPVPETVSDNGFHACRVSSLGGIPDLDYALMLSGDSGLVKVVLYFNETWNDVYGTEGKETYQLYKQALSRKMGKEPTKAFEYMWGKLYDESDEFYQCLAYRGCGSYFSYWNDPTGVTVSVEIRGVSRGKGYIRILYEHPDFSKHVDKVDAAQKEQLGKEL